MERWETVEAVLAAKARFEASVPGYTEPAAYGVARIDNKCLTFGHVNDFGSTHMLPAAVLAVVCDWRPGNWTQQLDTDEFDNAITLLAPAEACTAFEHPNLWSWQRLRDGADGDSAFVVIFIGDAGQTPSGPEESAFRQRLSPNVP